MSIADDLIERGATFTVAAPFVRDTFTEYDEDGGSTSLTWKPGIEWVPYGVDDSRPQAHGMGSVTYTVVDVHKLPRPWPSRVFFTRKWTDPDGRTFGKNKLHIMTLGAFRPRTRSYRFAGWYNSADLLVEDLPDSEKARPHRQAARGLAGRYPNEPKRSAPR